MNKYRNTKSNGCDSKKEARRWAVLQQMEADGKISQLRRQVRIELIPAQRDEDGMLLERKCSYIADFVYKENDEIIYEDCKGFKTKEYRLKKKMLLFLKGIRIRET